MNWSGTNSLLLLSPAFLIRGSAGKEDRRYYCLAAQDLFLRSPYFFHPTNSKELSRPYQSSLYRCQTKGWTLRIPVEGGAPWWTDRAAQELSSHQDIESCKHLYASILSCISDSSNHHEIVDRIPAATHTVLCCWIRVGPWPRKLRLTRAPSHRRPPR